MKHAFVPCSPYRWAVVLVFPIIACRPDAKEGHSTARSKDAAVDEPIDLLEPTSCRDCHRGQFEEWSASMHAYAAEDPLFLAMNRRGQEETNGALGAFCVNCHAPVAVREGLTQDGLNLDELPEKVRGVTCYFCHSPRSVEGTHNNPIELRTDGVLLGPFHDPVDVSAHQVEYSPYLDTTRPESAALCGSCHDVTIPAALSGQRFELERTFAEWKTTLFARTHEQGGLTCGGCHMPVSPRRERAANFPNAPVRRSRRHDFEGVDLALTPFPGRERQRVLVEQALATTLLAEICVTVSGAIQVTLENAGAGHHWPSGASQDREAWLDVKAYTAGARQPSFQTSEPASMTARDAGFSSEAPVLRDFVVDQAGERAHMFWEASELESSSTLQGVATRDPTDPAFHRERRSWLLNQERSEFVQWERVTLTVRIRPVALDVLDDLVESGHLDPEIVTDMPVIDLLPNRCYPDDVRERYPDIFPGETYACSAPDEMESDSDRSATLVWRRADLGSENPRHRQTEIDGLPAECLSHPSYVGTP